MINFHEFLFYIVSNPILRCMKPRKVAQHSRSTHTKRPLGLATETATTDAALAILRHRGKGEQLLEIRCTIARHWIPSFSGIPRSIWHEWCSEA